MIIMRVMLSIPYLAIKLAFANICVEPGRLGVMRITTDAFAPFVLREEKYTRQLLDAQVEDSQRCTISTYFGTALK